MYHVCAHLLDTSTSTGTVIEMKDNVVPGTGTGTGTGVLVLVLVQK